MNIFMQILMNTEKYKEHVYVVILCGGGGTSEWPLSISKKPKQIMKFYANKTLFQETIVRALEYTDISRIVIITSDMYVDEIKKEVPQILDQNIIGEPMKRNTALAMGVAAAFVYQKDPSGVIINLASDHVITKLDIYRKTLLAGALVSFEKHYLISVGITPTFAHAGLGYIQKGVKIGEYSGMSLNKVTGFKEKPSTELAQQFLDSGNYLWNANNYIWRADDILEAFDKLSPEIAKQIRKIQPFLGTKKQSKAINSYYPESPQEPIDTAISEKTDNLYVLPGDFGWHDIGGWQVVYELGKKDDSKNVVIPSQDTNNNIPVIMEESNGSLVYSGKQPIAVLGLSNIVVVDTGVGLLVCDRKKSNDVKNIVAKLQKDGFDKYI